MKKRMIKLRKIAWKGEKVGERNMSMSSTWTAQERKICLVLPHSTHNFQSYLRLTFLLPYCNSYKVTHNEEEDSKKKKRTMKLRNTRN